MTTYAYCAVSDLSVHFKWYSHFNIGSIVSCMVCSSMDQIQGIMGLYLKDGTTTVLANCYRRAFFEPRLQNFTTASGTCLTAIVPRSNHFCTSF